MLSRSFVSFSISEFTFIKQQLLHWANRFTVFCFLDSNNYAVNHTTYECILAAGVHASVNANAGEAFTALKEFSDQHQDWLFGHFSYDLKNELEQLTSTKPDGIGFDDLFFFVPEIIILLNTGKITIAAPSTAAAKELFDEISQVDLALVRSPSSFSVEARMSKEEYSSTVRQLQNHIRRGDCYEINFCQEFYAAPVSIDPLQVYTSLSTVSPNPFAAYYRNGERFLLCASPERYLKKEADVIISQPIKGTGERDLSDAAHDRANRDALYGSSKERSENVMIVDLVRNDLSRVCEEGSVQVDELYGIYSFPQLHQMISTISGKVRKDLHWTEIIKATFPMGSMTGAPKKRVMELIEKYERTRRNLFSGALGYVDPDGSFDFNVIIRSILYNEAKGYLSYQVGSGITTYSDPEKEYEECLLKAAAMRKVLGLA